MEQNEMYKAIEHLLENCPDVLTPKKIVRWSPLGKNTVYEIIKKGELRSFKYRGTYLIAKSDLVQYLVDHANDKPRRNLFVKEKMADDKEAI